MTIMQNRRVINQKKQHLKIKGQHYMGLGFDL
eukprot:CAMPEP_0170564072 /NCGR_PEP_ID=MMETSP0211-20121228/70768_1 /TAXON_ID=311385 /ORGANISM="Pseudokeronopsis sp., Strain OXSARD2" /LENGTH=31 /DNA_ID= /DNA_START= /DNA_END= /DNA_ORIENTATION=